MGITITEEGFQSDTFKSDLFVLLFSYGTNWYLR